MPRIRVHDRDHPVLSDLAGDPPPPAFPGQEIIDRPSSNAWSHPDMRAAVEATGRRKLVMAGLVTEVCLAQTVLGALKDGYEVYFVSDASGGISKEAHDDAKVRMEMAGAKPLNWMAVTAEWAPYWAAPERAAISLIDTQLGTTTSALPFDWINAQITSGIIKLPDSLSAYAQGKSS
jgi:Isochorismatase family